MKKRITLLRKFYLLFVLIVVGLFNIKAQTTSILASYCGNTLDAISINIYAVKYSAATKYRFKVTDGTRTDSIDKTVRYFNFTQLPYYKYNTTYTVSVALEIGGIFKPYGPTCIIITPNYKAELLPEYCDTLLPSVGTNVYSYYVFRATKYRFKVDDGLGNIQYLDKTTNRFNFTQLGSFNYNTAYSVSLAVEIDGVFGDYGPACTVTTPVEAAAILPEYCGQVIAEVGTNVVAYYIFGATNYRFKVDDGIGNIQYLDKTVNQFNFTQLSSFSYNTSYFVSVAAELNGVLGEYSPTCLITTPNYTIQLLSEYCDTILPNIGTNVYSTYIYGATNYMFRVNDGTTTQTIDKTVNHFNFTQLSSFNYAETYSVDVRVKIDGIWGNYGTACNVTTPTPSTKLITAQCGFTVQNILYDTLFAVTVDGVESYTFTIIDGGSSESKTVTSRWIRPSDFATLAYNKTYKVVVKTTMNGITGYNGDTCLVTITPFPWTKIWDTQCNKILTAVTNRVYATAVTGITDYQFRIINESETLYVNTGTTRSFVFNTAVPTYKYGTTYSVDVSLKYQDTYQPYGTICTLTTPPLTTKVQTAQCGSTLATITTFVNADFVYGLIDGIYRFRITKDGASQYLEKTTQKFRFTELSYTLGATYAVDVQLRHNGVWGEYGTPCNITLPATKGEILAIDNSNESSEFTVNVAPNPFTNTFRINLSDEQLSSDKIDVVLYNSTGQIIERYSSNSAGISSLNIGETCAKGIYILKVVTGNKISINKLIKE